MIQTTPVDCPHTHEYWDLLSGCWRCVACQDIAWTADGMAWDGREEVKIGDCEPITDEANARLPKVPRR